MMWYSNVAESKEADYYLFYFFYTQREKYSNKQGMLT